MRNAERAIYSVNHALSYPCGGGAPLGEVGCAIFADPSGIPLIDAKTLEAFLAAHHILVTPEGSSQELFEDALAKRGLERHCALRIPHFMSMPFVVASSDLTVTVLPAVAELFWDLGYSPGASPAKRPLAQNLAGQGAR